MPGAPMTAFELRALKKIASGRGALLGGDGAAAAGPLRIPPVVVKRLRAADLVEVFGTRLVATSAGCAHLRRCESRAADRQRAKRSGNQESFRAQHGRQTRTSRQIGATRREVLVNQAETPLGWLLGRRGRGGRPLISQRQFDAGERLRRDFTLAGLGPRVTRSYDAGPGNRRGPRNFREPDPTERQIEARRRYHAALDAVGPGLSDALIQVCCLLDGLDETERALGWPSRSAKVVLGIALDRLAAHYGL